MATDILVRARKTKTGGKSYEYRFEMASIGGKRQWSSKGGYRSEKAARIAGIAALNTYNACGKTLQRNEMSFSDFLKMWMESECVPTLKESTVLNYQKKITMKRWVGIIVLCLCTCLFLTGLTCKTSAADVIASGQCGENGDNVTWMLNSEGILIPQ